MIDHLDPNVIEHCRNVLVQYSNWIHGLPNGNNEETAEGIREVAGIMAAFRDCYNRTERIHECAGSQCGEDSILAELLPDQRGIYIDIGAGEPVQCSNTWAFYERGWRGLLIEPLPEHILQLVRYRPGDAVFPVAASNRTGAVPFYSDGTVSSCLQGWSKTAPKSPMAVECMAIAEILDMPDFQCYRNECSLCSIDVEGHESAVLSNLPWDQFSPEVFCVEYRKYETDRLGDDISAEWEPILIENGYRLHATTALNKIYVLGAQGTVDTEEAEEIEEKNMEPESNATL